MLFLDMDELIVQKNRHVIQRVFAKYGEPAFRKIEAEVLAEVYQQDVVLSTGGGVVLKTPKIVTCGSKIPKYLFES